VGTTLSSQWYEIPAGNLCHSLALTRYHPLRFALDEWRSSKTAMVLALTQSNWNGSEDTGYLMTILYSWTGFTSINEGFCSEPLPHECAGRSIIHGGDEVMDVVIYCPKNQTLRWSSLRRLLSLKLQALCGPTFVKSHYICHDLTSIDSAWAS